MLISEREKYLKKNPTTINDAKLGRNAVVENNHDCKINNVPTIEKLNKSKVFSPGIPLSEGEELQGNASQENTTEREKKLENNL